jgi:cytochrome d ubiquinol oxidase subunit I
VTRRERDEGSSWLVRAACATPLLGLVANAFGWIFTEMGRQPWAVFGMMNVQSGVSTGVSTLNAWISIIALTLLYGFLAVIEVGLMVRAIKKGPDEFVEPPDLSSRDSDDEDRPLAFAY